ncbi:hypothetical protein [Oscillatoria acuminata]|uniref:Uncharacterized protein n=1 Tax=Oscillatoria acuminata PCC 6304 TaxID=56110 RepID=K9TKA1_9CYAN|nr:hypothetical protein [Oscillatoria acuminata]AFY82975.1 hypothetical protein Oscil6304_3405 [Oscillatoria acuminata PCC 6304]
MTYGETLHTITERMPISTDEILERIFKLRQITRLDQQLLMSGLLSPEAIKEADWYKINQVFDLIHQGLIRVVD